MTICPDQTISYIGTAFFTFFTYCAMFSTNRRAMPIFIPLSMKKFGSWSLYTYSRSRPFSSIISHVCQNAALRVSLSTVDTSYSVYSSTAMSVEPGISRGLRAVKSTAALEAEISIPWTVDCEGRTLILIGGYSALVLSTWLPLRLPLPCLSYSSLYNSSRTASGISLWLSRTPPFST